MQGNVERWTRGEDVHGSRTEDVQHWEGPSMGDRDLDEHNLLLSLIGIAEKQGEEVVRAQKRMNHE